MGYTNNTTGTERSKLVQHYSQHLDAFRSLAGVLGNNYNSWVQDAAGNPILLCSFSEQKQTQPTEGAPHSRFMCTHTFLRSG